MGYVFYGDIKCIGVVELSCYRSSDRLSFDVELTGGLVDERYLGHWLLDG